VSAGLGLFRPEGGTEVEHLSEGHTGGFEVQLSRLRQIGVPHVEVGDFEEGSRTFPDRSGKNRRVDQDKSSVVVEVPQRSNGFVTNSQQSTGLARTKPEVTVLQQEIDAVLFFRYGEILFGILDNREPGYGQLIAGRGALIFANPASDQYRCLHLQVPDGFETRGITLALYGDTLDAARPVPQLEEMDFPL